MTLTRQEISLLAHRRHPIACPLTDESVGMLIEALGLDGGRLLDAALLRQTAREHWSGYRDGYRGVLGYLAVVARRPAMH